MVKDEPNSASIGPWAKYRFAMAACLVQLIAPIAGLFLADSVFGTGSGMPTLSMLFSLLSSIPSLWRLAMEPLLIALILSAYTSSLPNRRTGVVFVAMISILNAIASGMVIVVRSL